MSSLGPEDDDEDHEEDSKRSGSPTDSDSDNSERTSRAMTAEEPESLTSEKRGEDLEGKRGKRVDRKMRKSALDDNGRSETKVPMESLANSLDYLQEMLEELNSLRNFL